MRRYATTLIIALTSIILTAVCGGEPVPVPAPAATPVAAARLAPTPTHKPTASPTPKPTHTPTATPNPTVTPTYTPTPTPEPTATPVPTNTPTPSPTATTVPTNTPTPAPQSVSAQPSGDLPTTEVVRILAPSVVKIETEIETTGALSSPLGLGTGVIIDDEGHILTSNHVVAGIERVTVTLRDGEALDAEIVGRDWHTDLAVLKTAARGLRPARLGDSSALLVGQDVIAIGHALGLGDTPTVSKGVVSALGRTIGTERNTTMVDLIQTDASINLGNSGGPLANAQAAVVGINTSILRAGQGIGFAININDAKIVAEQIVERGSVRRGYMGVLFSDLTTNLIYQLGLDNDIEGVLLTRVVPDSPAWNAGLRIGDIILTANGKPMPTTGELLKFLMMHPPGEAMETSLLRDDELLTISLVLGERPTN